MWEALATLNKSSELLVDEDKLELDGNDTSSSEQSNISSPFDTSQIRIEPKSQSLDLLITRMKNNEIDLEPAFQRQAGIWNDQAQSRLIESLLLRIPIPAFYFDATDYDNWLVVDGLQRLMTLKRFVIDESLCLNGLEFLDGKYHGYTYSQLPRPLQRTINETQITAYLIMPGTPDGVKFNVFKRINTGGLPLSAQEIRHALNQGQITNTLKELAASEEFQVAVARGVSSKRMDDRDCIARFFAFSLTQPSDYREDYDSFINTGMAKANQLSEQDLNALAQNFLRVMRYVPRIFGNDAFRKRYTKNATRSIVNKALFESWTFNLGQLSDNQLEILVERRDKLKEAFIALMADRDFDNAVTQGTGSLARVKLRYNKIRGIIQEILSC